MTLGLVCSFGDVGPTKIAHNDDPRLTLTYFIAKSNLITGALIWGKS